MNDPHLLPVLLVAVLLAGSGCADSAPQPAGAARPETVAVGDRREGGLLQGIEPPTVVRERQRARGTGALPTPQFVDVHRELGLRFVFDNGTSRAKLMVESTSGGVAWLDYDADGAWDLFLPQGGNPFAEREERRPANDQLFRNLAGREFVRVTDGAGLSDAEFGHGAAAGDFDSDGFDDVYVSNVGPDILYQNMGDGTFRDVTRAAGIDNPHWASSAAWFDLDGDADLDVYVCNYVAYDPWNPISCLSEEGEPGICHPDNVDGVPNKCYFNQGDGTFRDEADERGLNGPGSKSLGVVVADLNGDDLPDVFVANDTTANHLFINLGDARFEERALAMGCALSGLGQFQASMGIGFADYDENGYPDLYCTHFTMDSNTLYANFGPHGFEDVTRKVGLHLPTLPYLAFGTVMADFDSNGRQDVFIANGHIDDWRKKSGDMWYMKAQMFTFDGRTWHECGRDGGPYFGREWLGRGVASADYDDDGDLDLAVVHQNDPLALLRNDSVTGHSLRFRFVGSESNRRGIGAAVTVTQADRRLVQQLAGGTSYCVSHQPLLHFGLGQSKQACEVTVQWPSGRRQTLSQVAVDQTVVLHEREAELP